MTTAFSISPAHLTAVRLLRSVLSVLFRAVVLWVLLMPLPPRAEASAAPLEPDLVKMVEADWDRQEVRAGREPQSVEALVAVVTRAKATAVFTKADSTRVGLGEMDAVAARAAAMAPEERQAWYRKVRWQTRERLLQQAGVFAQPIVFLQRNRFVCQMLHEYMGYFHDYGNVPAGGGVFVLENPGRSLRVRSVLSNRLAQGNFTTLALSFDAQKIYFAFAERSPSKPDFHSADRRSFHLYSVAPDGTGLRQLTSGVEDDFDPCPLPDGGVAFMSTRRGGFARCNNAWEPCASYTLHRMDRDGGAIRRLSVHETSEWHPSVMNDGRLVYIRWDYVDRSAANFHGLWTTNPDGSGPASLFGNYTMRINACYQPRPMPNSDKLLFVAGAHHADVGGALVLLDPRRIRLDGRTGEDNLQAIEVLTPEICFPESDGWPRSYFHSPWPLSESSMLVSFSFDPLPGMSSGESRDTRTGLYYFDRGGNLELLFQDAAISCMYPIPLTPRPTPPVIPSLLDPTLGSEGEFVLANVRESLFTFPANRVIRELRVFQLLPKPAPHTANQPRIGHANAENARMLLGTVPVEPDGSAYFRAPAGKALYFQAVDDTGRAVQTMRSAVYLQPGERRSCVGCHEPSGTAASSSGRTAMRRPPSRLEPGPEGSRPLSFPLLVQPVLDRHCVSCHDGQTGPGHSKLVLTGEPVENFSRSYQSLRPFLRWYEWGNASISQISSQPGQAGADASPLTRILQDSTHQPTLTWSDAERRRLYLWLDANVPFYGSYLADEQLAQREGKSIEPPSFQ